MADAHSVTIRDATNAPVTTGVTMAVYVDRTGAARTPPALTHLGGGKWAFTPSDADETVGTVAMFDAGANNEPRRPAFAIHKPDQSNQFFAFSVLNPDGSVWAGAAPTLGLYDDPAGNPRTPPALVAAAAAYLWSLSPSTADIAAGIELRIDMPAGAAGDYLDGSTVQPSPWNAPSPGPLKDPAYDVAYVDSATISPRERFDQLSV